MKLKLKNKTWGYIKGIILILGIFFFVYVIEEGLLYKYGWWGLLAFSIIIGSLRVLQGWEHFRDTIIYSSDMLIAKKKIKQEAKEKNKGKTK